MKRGEVKRRQKGIPRDCRACGAFQLWDYPVAKALAPQVICCLQDFGTMNERNRQLALLGKDKTIEMK